MTRLILASLSVLILCGAAPGQGPCTPQTASDDSWTRPIPNTPLNRLRVLSQHFCVFVPPVGCGCGMSECAAMSGRCAAKTEANPAPPQTRPALPEIIVITPREIPREEYISIQRTTTRPAAGDHLTRISPPGN